MIVVTKSISANNLATGQGVIYGADASNNATVGTTLTVDASGVGDIDGLGQFTYEWRNSNGSGGATSAAVQSSTSNAYTIQQSDRGFSVWCVIRFTDALGHSEGVACYAPGFSAVFVP